MSDSTAAAFHDAHDHAGHDHAGHDHAGHDHGAFGHSHGAGVQDERKLSIAFGILTVFLAAEVIGGLLSGSLALLADAGHMVSDVVALGMSWAALRIGRRPANTNHSYGYKRLEVLVAFANGCTLLVVSVWIAVEAVRRLFEPVPVVSGLMLGVAIIGLLANAVSLAVLRGSGEGSLNMKGVWLHVLSDLLGFAAAILAALIIMMTGWVIADPLLSLLFAAMILRSAAGVVRGSAHVLLQGTPPGLNTGAIAEDLRQTVPGVEKIHHLHAWSLTGSDSLITLHAVTTSTDRQDEVLCALHTRLREQFGITHATVQMETPATALQDHCGLQPGDEKAHDHDHDGHSH